MSYNLGGLSSVCAKLEPLRPKNNEILEINVLQKFTPHALCKFTYDEFGSNFAKPGLIEHSEHKVIAQSGLLGNEIGPGVLQYSVQQTSVLQECQRHKAKASIIGGFDSGLILWHSCRMHVC